MCLLCNEHEPSEEKVEKFQFLGEALVEQAILEGKRQRIAYYFFERGRPIPRKVRIPVCRMALYEAKDKIVPKDMGQT